MLNVTGIGMVSSLGLDVVTSCAAARAGIVRAQELDVQIVDRETQDLVPVVGHVIPLTQGFTHTGRLLRIAQLALADLQRLNDWTSEDPERLLTYFVLPPADRAWQPLRYPPDPAVAYVNCRQSQLQRVSARQRADRSAGTVCRFPFSAGGHSCGHGIQHGPDRGARCLWRCVAARPLRMCLGVDRGLTD